MGSCSNLFTGTSEGIIQDLLDHYMYVFFISKTTARLLIFFISKSEDINARYLCGEIVDILYQ